MFEVIKTQGRARRGVFQCAHGTVQTPVFMNVGTQAAIKGAVSALDLKEIGCQVELSNTYHLHLRPGDGVVKEMGGLHKFMHWDGPILTDSGGFQVFSLSGLRKIKEEGVTFASHIDGRKIFMGPEESMRIQSNLGSDIAMAFDECVENPATYEYAKNSCERTLRWLARCKEEHDKLNAQPDAVNPHQMLFGINQGATFPDLRVWHMQETAKIDCDGYAIGGLAVGEPTQVMYDIIDAVEPHMPKDKPRYLMGVGGRAPSTSRTRSTSWTRAPSTPSATARCAGISPGATCATSSWRGRCWPCVWRCSTTCTSITPSWPTSAPLWTRGHLTPSGRRTARSWTSGCKNCQKALPNRTKCRIIFFTFRAQ